MKVVRYTFDICIKDGCDKDVYSLASELEKSIMKTEYVCGCEVRHTHSCRFNSVDVDRVIKIQNDIQRNIEEDRRW